MVSVPFPKMSQSKTDRSTLKYLLTSKFGMRKLGQGGPILQPQFFKALEWNDKLVRELQTLLKIRISKRRNLPSDFLGEEDFISFEKIHDLLKNQKTDYVFKPNNSAYGEGVAFIVSDKKGGRTLVASARNGNLLEKVLKELGLQPSNLKQENIYTLSLEANDPALAKKISMILGILPILAGDGQTYDPGLIEEKMNFLQWQGRSYETRHGFQIRLKENEIVLHFKPEAREEFVGKSASYARIGSPDPNSQQSLHDTEERNWNKMYDPIFEMLPGLASRRIEFEEKTNQLMAAQIRYYYQRLRASGISLGQTSYGEVDVQWLAPVAGQLPQPYIIESSLLSDWPN
jgi:hypothetical protein